MKKIILAVFCLMLTVAAGRTEEFHLVERQIHDGSAAARATIYVLLLPDHNPVLFETFDSKAMEMVIGSTLATGSVLHFDPDPELGLPAEDQIKGLTAFCKTKGITLKVSGRL